MLLAHLFVCCVRISFCHFSLSLGVGCWLRFGCGTPWAFLLTSLQEVGKKF